MKDLLKGILYISLFAIPFIPIIVTDSMFFPYITGKNFTFRILVEIAFGAWALLALLDARYRPKFSWILSSVSLFLVVMFFADALGEYPLKSFWSNFERMDGFVTLIHFYVFFVVLSSTLGNDRKLWGYYLWTTLAAAAYVAFDGLSQYINKEGSWRVDSTLGNAAYMAIYMLFHAFFSLYLLIQSKQWWTRSILGIFFALFSYVLILTATRGTFLGLIAGLGVAVVYMLIFAKEYPVFRKTALAALIVLVLGVGAIFTFRDSAFIQSNPVFDRLASISIDDLDIRFIIWNMAFEGVKDRPILGWGQGNFNYIFNQYYDAELMKYNAEAWYDRAHNVAFDWLTAGGIIGFVAYLSMFFVLVWYLFVRPLIGRDPKNEDAVFTVPERAILTGLIAAYFTHNLVVFDNIVSVIFIGVTIALIHGRLGVFTDEVESFDIDPRIVTNIAAPVVAVCVGCVVYFVNVPGIHAASDVIRALMAQTIPDRLEHMENALARDSFARQEIVEQFGQQAMQIAANPNIPAEQKQAFVMRAEQELLSLAYDKPGDARVHVFTAGFYRSVGLLDKAKEQIQIARDLSPNKQAIILEQGIIEYQVMNFEGMHEYFKTAYELEPNYPLARIFYASSLLYVDRAGELESIITDEWFKQFAMNDFALQSANQFGQTDLMKRMYGVRIENAPQNSQYRASLAFLHYSDDEIDEAIAVIQAGVDTIPSFEKMGMCYIENLRAGVTPDAGCTQNGRQVEQGPQPVSAQ